MAELGVVDDPRVGELVERVEVLAHGRLRDADGAQGEAAGSHEAWLGAGGGVDALDEGAGGGGAVDGEVPDLTGCLGTGCEGDEAGGDVGCVGVAVRLVGVAHDLGGLAAQRRDEDGFAEGGAQGGGAEVVRRAADGYFDVAGGVRGEEFFGHGGAGGGLLRRRVGCHGFDERCAVGWAVGVQVVEDDEPGAGVAGAGDDAALQGRELLGPTFVAQGVEAEVDGVGALTCFGGKAGVGGVAADDACAGEGAVAVAVDCGDVVACGGEVGDEGAADLAGSEDDVT